MNAPTTNRAKGNRRTSAVDAVTETTEATEATEAKPAEAKPTEAKPATVAPALDFGSLVVEDAPAPTVAAGAGRKAQDNSVAEGWLRASWDNRGEGKIGAGKAVTVPTAAVGVLKSRLNIAAKTLAVGVTIEVTDAGNDTSRVVFAAKTRKQPRKAKTEATEAKPAEATEAPAA